MSSRPQFNYHYEKLNNNEPNCSTANESSNNNNLYSNGSATNGNNNNNQNHVKNHEKSDLSNHQLIINNKHHSHAHHSHSSSSSSAADFIISSGASGGPILVQLPFRHLITFTVGLPLVVFIFNIVYVLHVDFDLATNTVCKDRVVRNNLPSFSSVIGQFNVAKSLWGIAIALHAAPRFLFVAMTYSYLLSIVHTRYYKWVKFAIACHFAENIGLIVLSYVPSNIHFPTHMWSFITFLGGSVLFMLIYCTLLGGKKYRNIPIASSSETRSINFKWKLFCVNVLCTILSTLAYYRHEATCEDGIYTLFAFFEYIVVITNMGFHLTSYWDFSEKMLRI